MRAARPSRVRPSRSQPGPEPRRVRGLGPGLRHAPVRDARVRVRLQPQPDPRVLDPRGRPDRRGPRPGHAPTSRAPNVDDQIIAAVQRVLTSPGSPVDISRISAITIYKAIRQRRPARLEHDQHLDPRRRSDRRRRPAQVQVEHRQLERLHPRQRLVARLDRGRPRLQLPPDQPARGLPRDGRDPRLPDVRPHRHGAQPELGDATDGSPGPTLIRLASSGARAPERLPAVGVRARGQMLVLFVVSHLRPDRDHGDRRRRAAGTGRTPCASSAPPTPPPWPASSGCRARRARAYTTAKDEATKNGYTDGSGRGHRLPDQGPGQQPAPVGDDHRAGQHVLHEDLRDPRR